MKVLIAHPGTQYSYQLANQLERAGLLYRFYTCLGIGNNSFTGKLLQLLPATLYNKFSNRIIESVASKKIRNFPFLEIHTINSKRNVLQYEEMLYKRNEKFQQLIPDAAIQNSDVIIGFDTSSWILAERCKKLGKKFILDVSIGHPVSKEKIYLKLGEDYPMWKEQIVPKRQAYIDRENREMELADLIIVPGEFVKQTLEENAVAVKKIRVNQFGTNTELFRCNMKDKQRGKKVRFLFMGAFSARKGLPFLLEVWDKLQPVNAELIIAGYGKIPEGIKLPANVVNKGMIAKDQRKEIFSNADVFLFPSFFEGLAQVQIEAMSSGLPLVGTKNSGACDLVDDGINGKIIEAGNTFQLEQAINFFISHPEQIKEMGLLAQEKAIAFTWDNYGERWKRILAEITR